MRSNKYFLFFILLLIAQILVCIFFNLSQLLMVSVLPVLILFAPLTLGTTAMLLIAFVSGFAVDFFATGQLGLTSMALMPVAMLRPGILKLVFGNEIFVRGEDLSKARQGAVKITLALLMAISVFLILYIWVDAAGTRSFWFNLVKYLLSLIASYIVSLLVTEMICP